jgi:hypothetical protein
MTRIDGTFTIKAMQFAASSQNPSFRVTSMNITQGMTYARPAASFD